MADEYVDSLIKELELRKRSKSGPIDPILKELRRVYKGNKARISEEQIKFINSIKIESQIIERKVKSSPKKIKNLEQMGINKPAKALNASHLRAEVYCWFCAKWGRLKIKIDGDSLCSACGAVKCSRCGACSPNGCILFSKKQQKYLKMAIYGIQSRR